MFHAKLAAIHIGLLFRFTPTPDRFLVEMALETDYRNSCDWTSGSIYGYTVV